MYMYYKYAIYNDMIFIMQKIRLLPSETSQINLLITNRHFLCSYFLIVGRFFPPLVNNLRKKIKLQRRIVQITVPCM